MSEPRYINANDLKDTLDYYISEAGWTAAHNEALTWVKDEFIDAERTADVASVVHGKWVEPSYKRKKAGICGSTDAMAGKCRCSVCRHEEPVFEEYPKYNYCPYCGAKMDESEGNT